VAESGEDFRWTPRPVGCHTAKPAAVAQGRRHAGESERIEPAEMVISGRLAGFPANSGIAVKLEHTVVAGGLVMPVMPGMPGMPGEQESRKRGGSRG
jgi:hypothetical protein